MGNTFGKVWWEGLEISVLPVTPEAPVQLTGNPYVYALTIKNLTKEVRNGAFGVLWRIDETTFRPHIIPVKDLAPLASFNAGLPMWIPTREGFAELRLHKYCAGKGIESNLNHSTEVLVNLVRVGDQFTLYSTPVKDKEEYETGQKERREQRQRDRLLIIVSSIAAVASTVAAIILIFYH